jgi:hypothetical protein
MVNEEASLADHNSTPGLAALAAGAFRGAAAIAAVICAGRSYSYLVRSGLLDSASLPPDTTANLLHAGPAILAVFLKLAVSLLILGSCGWGLALLVRWTAAGVQRDSDA